MSLGEREAELLETLEAVIDAELPYVLVGGWAIAAFNQRFTTDVDVVIPGQAVDDYTALLVDRGYEKTADVERNDRYESRTLRFEKDIGNPVRFDAMVDALGCRQTEAEWSYRYLAQHSVTEELRTGRPVTARIPARELLFAVKLHSGRTADARDLVVLAAGADFDRITTHLHRGDLEKLAERIDTVLELSGRIRERHRRRHRNNGARYHSCDPSATAVSDSYCIFWLGKSLFDGVRL